MAETGEKPIKVLDLFSGIGGFSLGLERAGMQTVAFCEWDKKAAAVLRKHWPSIPVFDDVRTLKGKHVGSVDLICGGFPCQDISVAGKGAGLAGERSGLWWEFHRLIKEIKPRWVIAENVSALRSRGLDEVLRSLAEIGYDAEWHCIPASAVGAPHRRDRIWIVAYPSQLQRNGSDDYSRKCLESETSPEFGNGSRSPNVVDSTGFRLQGQGEPEQPKHPTPVVNGEAIESQHGRVAGFWATEPALGRVANGVSGRVDRLKQLGNAVVPQIPEIIGKAIIQWEEQYGR